MNLSEYNELRTTVGTPYGEFAYIDVGEGPAAVFIHGLNVSAYLWRNVVEQLSDQRRCIAYNLPAHGFSRVSDDQDLSLDSQTEMLAAFCDALQLNEFDLVANDTGGAIAQVYAVRHPDRLRTLTLTNCEARDVLPSSSELAQLIESLAAKGEMAPIAIQQLEDYELARGEVGLGAAFERPEDLSDEDIHGYLEHHFASLEDAREIERTVNSMDADQLVAIQPQLKELEVPTLVVWGTGDDIFDLELAHWLRDNIPGCSEVIEVDGGRLFWPGERPDELVEPLRRLWSAEPAEAAVD